MLTVRELTAELGFELASGVRGAGRAIRWVHISELADPTPFLSGQELLLTTGPKLTDARKQRAYVRRLDELGIAGVGFGTGFEHSELPKAIVAEAEERGLPLFEVPYETPFIAITEHAFTSLVNEHYAVLERGIEIHQRLEGLVLEERGLEEILAAIAAAIAGPALLYDSRGTELARSGGRRAQPGAEARRELGVAVATRSAADRLSPFVVEEGSMAERAFAVPVPAGRDGQAGSWLVVTKGSGTIGDAERLLARQAAMVVALELMRERVVRETERRLAGDVLAEALGGGLDGEAIRSRLRPFGLGERAAVLVFDVDDPGPAEGILAGFFDREGVPALIAVTTTTGRPLLCAVAGADEDALDLARAARGALTEAGTRARAAVSQPREIAAVRHSFHEARCALEATALANGDAPEVASHEDLGAFTLLLSVADEDALRAYAEGVLGPIEGDGDYGPELLRSLEAFIERNGQWEAAARELYVHRHTLRYRIRKIEELTGRDLGHAQDRIEMWLALRAKELVR